jgi:ATP-dependent DNA helicase PIF1
MVGQRIVLSASFIGGPHDMRRRYMDAMTLVGEYRKPDIFLTMMCNPNWDEIHAELLQGQSPSDHPDLLAHLFKAKLEAMKELLYKNIYLVMLLLGLMSLSFKNEVCYMYIS